MSDALQFRILGGVSLRVAGDPVPLGPPKQRQVLSLLLIHRRTVVHSERLIEELWNDRPPASGTANLRSYVAQLRRCLPPGQRHRLARHPTGYSLSVELDELDLDRFEDLLAQGRGALTAGDPATAVRLLERAVAVWRGRCCEDIVPGPVLGPLLDAVDERLVVASEDLAESRLRSGDAPAAIDDLRPVVSAHPTRERPAELLMRALYEGGDTGAALKVFATLRSALADTLGIEPGPSAQELHRAMLNRSLAPRDSTAPATGAPVSERTWPVPRQLPRAVSLVGRADERSRTQAALVSTSAGTTPAVVLIHGPEGAGASALARAVAHAAAPWFPDGQLYAEFRHAGGREQAHVVLTRFLRALGFTPPYGPVDLDEAAAAFRSAVADRRVLVVVDGAADPSQIEPLLPGTAGNAVLITARAVFPALPDVERVALGPLTTTDATVLLRRWLVAAPRRRTSASTSTVAEQCGRLPGALRSAAVDG